MGQRYELIKSQIPHYYNYRAVFSLLRCWIQFLSGERKCKCCGSRILRVWLMSMELIIENMLKTC